MGYAPENTMPAFRCGHEMGADFLECDVHLSKDRKCVVMHDEGLERTTSGAGWIRDMRSSQIKKFDAGSWFSRKFKGTPVPLLEELLSWASAQTTSQNRPLGIVIEIKNEPIRYFQIEKKVIETVFKTRMQDRVIVISFDHGVVKRAKIICPDIATGILYREPLENPFDRAKQVRADALFPRRHLVSPALVAKAHKKRIPVIPWTVNQKREMKKLIGFGVDGITTNYPERLNKILK
jgi:glycerophosphoryl diester phosphodiesterase